MSTKAARGTKRVCQSCGSKFYDLNRAPITCPICHAIFQQQEIRGGKAAPAGNTVEEDDEDLVAAPAGAVEIVSLDEAEADLPDLEGDDLVEIEDDDADLKADDETFIEVEEDDGGDVSGIVGGPREDDDEV